ncbi:DUF2007 domain-containing protein [Luteolibacter flavescens]|uniref:DUF2007 domain-containing protein n=1 Tax=Luteolibacter flavescens TaxID=1859460 RepID=A0ABT3FP43_9BACT|nr:DUF2007 domain-containing protein [Luteolibacter flavescens]MCW1885342.1 DUF2007 domain-containing protein [Luteolibacter flavescens]
MRERTLIKLSHYQAVLEGAGIPTFIRNESLAHLEVPIPTFCPALCVVEDGDYERAMQLLHESEAEAAKASIEDCTCGKCGETNPHSFDICWNCGTELAA